MPNIKQKIEFRAIVVLNIIVFPQLHNKKTVFFFTFSIPTIWTVCVVMLFVLFFRLVVPNKGYSSLDQSPDEKPLVALDTDRYVH